MLTNPTYTKLQELRLHTMAHMFKEQLEQALSQNLKIFDKVR